MKGQGYFDGLVCVFLLIVPVIGDGFIYEDNTSEDLGHVRNSNGTILWGSLPKGLYHGITRDAPTKGWEVTISFARAVINSIQTEPFPAETMQRLLKGEDIGIDKERYVVNIAIACFTGSLLIVFFLICMVVFLRHEYRRRKKDVYLVKKPYMRDKPFTFFVVSSYIGATLSLIYVICITVVSTNLHYGINVIDETVGGAMDDVTTYFQTTKQQYTFVAASTNDWFNKKVIGGDMNKIGELIWQPGRDMFYPSVSAVFESLADLDERTQKAAHHLTSIFNQLNSITDGEGGQLENNLKTLLFKINSARQDSSCTGCDGTCSGCKNIVPQDIAYQIDFRKLPNISTNVPQLSHLALHPINSTMQHPEYYYDKGIAAVLTTRVADAVSELNDTITRYSATVANSISGLKFPSQKDFFFPNFRESFQSFDKRLVVSDTVRYGFTWVFVFVNFVGCFILYLALTITVKGKREARRGGQPNYYPAYILYVAVSFGCIGLSLIFMALCMMTFYAGVNLEKVVCEPARKLQYMTEVLDIPDVVKNHPGYYLSSIILGNGSITMKSADMYRSCLKNEGSHQLYSHHLVPTIFQDLDYTQAFQTVDSSFDKMYVDLGGVSMVTSEFEAWILNFNKAAMFDLISYYDMLKSGVIKADVNDYINNIRTILNSGGPTLPAQDYLQDVADSLQDLAGSIQTVTVLKNNVLAEFELYQSEVKHIKNVTESAVRKLKSLDPSLQTRSSVLVRKGVDEYRQAFKATYADYKNRSEHWIRELGNCRPVADAYDALVYGFCDMLSDFENADWMLVGNNSVTLMCLLVFVSVVMYYLPDEDGDDTTDEFDSIFGNGPPKGLINKAIYKVKSVFIKRRPSKNGTVKPGSSVDSNGSNAAALLLKNGENLEMKNMPNGSIITSKTEKNPSPVSESAVVSPRTVGTDSTVSLEGSVSTPSLDTDTKSGTSKNSASTNKSRGVVNQGGDHHTGGASRPGSVVISEVHPRPKGVDLSPNVVPGSVVNSGPSSSGNTPSSASAQVLVTDIDV
ncbi:prominin-1-like [Haliotis cracherodii]|uniref:prominin-1-like n=1 Tax=Haliotis cracherodii TaxID=6455 RepID=UPI0039EA5B4E